MNHGNSFLKSILRGSLPPRSMILYCMLFFISFWIHGFVNAQEPRQKIPPRKATIVNKATLLQHNIRSNNRDLNPNRSLCDFTLTPVNSVSNPLSQIIQSLAGSGVTISNIQTNLPATSDIYGSFSCGSSANLGIESGLVLTTGVVGN